MEAVANDLRSDYPELLSDARITCPPGWEILVREILDYLENQTDADPNVMRIRSRHGKLRVDIDHGPTHVFRKIAEVERESLSVCQVCGDKGSKRRTSEGIFTLCSIDCKDRL